MLSASSLWPNSSSIETADDNAEAPKWIGRIDACFAQIGMEVAPMSTPVYVDMTSPVAADTLRVSQGNTFTYHLNANKDAFCITASNTKGTHDWVYQSNTGGLQPAGSACPADGAAF